MPTNKELLDKIAESSKVFDQRDFGQNSGVGIDYSKYLSIKQIDPLDFPDRSDRIAVQVDQYIEGLPEEFVSLKSGDDFRNSLVTLLFRGEEFLTGGQKTLLTNAAKEIPDLRDTFPIPLPSDSTGERTQVTGFGKSVSDLLFPGSSTETDQRRAMFESKMARLAESSTLGGAHPNPVLFGLKGTAFLLSEVAKDFLEYTEEEKQKVPHGISPHRNLEQRPLSRQETISLARWNKMSDLEKSGEFVRRLTWDAIGAAAGFMSQTPSTLINPELQDQTHGEALEETAVGFVQMFIDAPFQMAFIFDEVGQPGLGSIARTAGAIIQLPKVLQGKKIAELEREAVNHFYDNPSSLLFAGTMIRGGVGKLQKIADNFRIEGGGLIDPTSRLGELTIKEVRSIEAINKFMEEPTRFQEIRIEESLERLRELEIEPADRAYLEKLGELELELEIEARFDRVKRFEQAQAGVAEKGRGLKGQAFIDKAFRELDQAQAFRLQRDIERGTKLKTEKLEAVEAEKFVVQQAELTRMLDEIKIQIAKGEPLAEAQRIAEEIATLERSLKATKKGPKKAEKRAAIDFLKQEQSELVERLKPIIDQILDVPEKSRDRIVSEIADQLAGFKRTISEFVDTPKGERRVVDVVGEGVDLLKVQQEAMLAEIQKKPQISQETLTKTQTIAEQVRTLQKAQVSGRLSPTTRGILQELGILEKPKGKEKAEKTEKQKTKEAISESKPKKETKKAETRRLQEEKTQALRDDVEVLEAEAARLSKATTRQGKADRKDVNKELKLQASALEKAEARLAKLEPKSGNELKAEVEEAVDLGNKLIKEAEKKAKTEEKADIDEAVEEVEADNLLEIYEEQIVEVETLIEKLEADIPLFKTKTEAGKKRKKEAAKDLAAAKLELDGLKQVQKERLAETTEEAPEAPAPSTAKATTKKAPKVTEVPAPEGVGITIEKNPESGWYDVIIRDPKTGEVTGRSSHRNLKDAKERAGQTVEVAEAIAAELAKTTTKKTAKKEEAGPTPRSELTLDELLVQKATMEAVLLDQRGSLKIPGKRKEATDILADINKEIAKRTEGVTTRTIAAATATEALQVPGKGKNRAGKRIKIAQAKIFQKLGETEGRATLDMASDAIKAAEVKRGSKFTETEKVEFYEKLVEGVEKAESAIGDLATDVTKSEPKGKVRKKAGPSDAAGKKRVLSEADIRKLNARSRVKPESREGRRATNAAEDVAALRVVIEAIKKELKKTDLLPAVRKNLERSLADRTDALTKTETQDSKVSQLVDLERQHKNATETLEDMKQQQATGVEAGIDPETDISKVSKKSQEALREKDSLAEEIELLEKNIKQLVKEKADLLATIDKDRLKLEQQVRGLVESLDEAVGKGEGSRAAEIRQVIEEVNEKIKEMTPERALDAAIADNAAAAGADLANPLLPGSIGLPKRGFIGNRAAFGELGPISDLIRWILNRKKGSKGSGRDTDHIHKFSDIEAGGAPTKWMAEQQTLRPETMWQKIKAEFTSRFVVFPLLKKQESFFAYGIERLRQGFGAKIAAAVKAKDAMLNVVSGLDPSQSRLLGMRIIFEDLLEQIQFGGEVVRKFTKEELRVDLNRTIEFFSKDPVLAEAYRRHRNLMDGLRDDLIKRGLISPEQARGYWYAHIVRDYIGKSGVGGTRSLLKKVRSRYFEKRSLTETGDISKDYVEVYFDALRDIWTKTKLQDIQREVLEFYDITHMVEDGAIPEGYARTSVPLNKVFDRNVKQNDALHWDLADSYLRELSKEQRGDAVPGEGEYIVPLQLAETMRTYINDYFPKVTTLNRLNRKFKTFIITKNPFRYNRRNLVGDTKRVFDAMPGAFSPKWAGELKRSQRDLWDMIRTGAESKDLKAMLDRGAMHSSRTHIELEFERQTDAGISVGKKSALGRLADRYVRTNAFVATTRENSMRLHLAYYNMGRHRKGLPIDPGVSDITGLIDAAVKLENAGLKIKAESVYMDAIAKIARETPLDYGNFTGFETQVMAGGLIPFYRYITASSSWHYQLFKNRIFRKQPGYQEVKLPDGEVVRVAQHQGSRLAPLAGRGMRLAGKAAALTARVAWFQVMVDTWNNTVMQEYEDKMTEGQRDRFHFIMPYQEFWNAISPGPDEVKFFSDPGVIAEFLQNTGTEGFHTLLVDVIRGRISMTEAIAELPESFEVGAIKAAAQHVSPFFTIPIEVAMGRELGIDPTNARKIERTRFSLIWEGLGAPEITQITERFGLTRGYSESLSFFIKDLIPIDNGKISLRAFGIKGFNPEPAGWLNGVTKAYQWQEDHGNEFEGHGKNTLEVRNIFRMITLSRPEDAGRAIEELVKRTGSKPAAMKAFFNYMDNKQPLRIVSRAERAEYIKTLSPEEYRDAMRAGHSVAKYKQEFMRMLSAYRRR